MGLLRYGADLDVLLVTRGHPYPRDAFMAVFESWPDIACCAVEQPAAQAFFTPEAAAPWDAFVCYDMPGIEFTRDGAVFHEPPDSLRRGFRALLEAGQGIVFLHHAVAGWPTWEEYGDAVGARFLYEPGVVHGREYPDSGYRHAVRHRVTPCDPTHPVVRGLEEGFEIEDEVYLCPVFEDDVVPLLRSDHDFVDAHFYSASLAIRGKTNSREGWSHPRGSALVGWARRVGRSPLVTLTLGDGPDAYAHPGFRRLVENAIRWVASPEARAWAAQGL